MNPANDTIVQNIGQNLYAAQNILVVSHVRPDGDAVGSLLGLGLSLQAAGKDVQMALADGVPSNFRHLQGSEQIRRRPQGKFDLVCVVDCSDLKRAGETINGQTPQINIDHHVTNLNFAIVNLVDTHAVATAQILAELLPKLDLPITQPVAAALLTGLISDTLGFRTSNMNPQALRLAASLMEYGADLPELYRLALIERSYEATQYWGYGLRSMQREGRLAWTCLTLADRQAVGYPGRDDADLINILASIEDIDVVIIFVEQTSKRVKVSWRAQPGFDVSQIALQFGGGGHPPASGADLPGSMEEVIPRVLEATRPLVLHTPK